MTNNPSNNKIHTSILRHPIATLVVKGTECRGEPLITEILVGTKAKKAAEKLASPSRGAFLAEAVGLLRGYLDGKPVDFSTIHLDMEGLTAFQIAVLRAARGIPCGSTVSYSGLAKAAGHPSAIRAAATVMATNRFPIIIPCHRVIQKDGSIGAYSGDRVGEDAAIKRALLHLEKESSGK
jgi:O-6-methylguanine DNA methyltransferase